tara:strand:+ start:403 stop:2175 length:1773 start_codon:yes stop_codon:yes gene_type:complete
MITTTDILWFEGVVEEIEDPFGLFRVQVRCIYIHTSDKTLIPTEDLPWAQVMNPTTSAAMNGIGETPGIVRGTHVVGYFRDGINQQDPVVVGTIAGIPQSLPNSEQGFNDPTGQYPKQDHIDEPDTSRLARGENLSRTYIKKRHEMRVSGIQRSTGTTWDFPHSSYNAKYPYNKVDEEESGIVHEYDSTPGSERVASWHPAGTFTEIDSNGTVTKQVVGDKYEVLERNGMLYVKGSIDVTIDGSNSLYVKNAMNVMIDGKCTANFMNDVDLNVMGDMKTNVNGNMEYNVRGDTTYRSNGKILMTSGSGIDLKTTGTMNLGASGLLAIDGSLVHIGYGKTSGSHSNVGSIGSKKNPTMPHFPDLPSSGYTEELYNEHDTPDNPPTKEFYQKLSDLGLEAPSEIVPESKETEKKEMPKEEIQTEPVACEMFEGKETIPETTQLSKYYKLRDVSSSAVVSHYRVRPQLGLSVPNIVCNLKGLCENVLDKVKEEYPDMMVTSGFRHGTGRSQHYRGEAADMQFRNASKKDYYEIAKWIRDNIPHDQLILEFKNTGTGLPWIHCSFSSSGKQRAQHFTMFNNRRVSEFGEFKQYA